MRKLLGQRRRVGHVESLGHRGGAPRRLDERAVAAVRAAVAAQPDVALEELRLRLSRRARVRVSVPTLYRVIETLGMPRQKRRSSPAKPTKKERRAFRERIGRVKTDGRRLIFLDEPGCHLNMVAW